MSKSAKLVRIIGVLAGGVLLAGCFADPNPLTGVSPEGKPAGFWMGLWQGSIVGIAFVISLFSENVNIYEVHNRGTLYNLGFVLGATVLHGFFQGFVGAVLKGPAKQENTAQSTP